VDVRKRKKEKEKEKINGRKDYIDKKK